MKAESKANGRKSAAQKIVAHKVSRTPAVHVFALFLAFGCFSHIFLIYLSAFEFTKPHNIKAAVWQCNKRP